jgi:hypothetical protein
METKSSVSLLPIKIYHTHTAVYDIDDPNCIRCTDSGYNNIYEVSSVNRTIVKKRGRPGMSKCVIIDDCFVVTKPTKEERECDPDFIKYGCDGNRCLTSVVSTTSCNTTGR